jgi:sortase family protein
VGDALGGVPLEGVLGPSPPWQLGLATTVLAGVLLWAVTGRLRLRPETRAASTALFACGALLSQVSTDGVDGRATLLLSAAALGAASGRRRRVRTLLAVLACLGAVALAPVVGVGLLALLGVMALTRDLAARLPPVARWALGCSGLAAAAALATLLARLGATPSAAVAEPPTVPAAVAAALAAATVLVGGVLWARQPWVRPPVGAVGALAACLALPGPGPTAVLPVTAGIAVLGAVLVEECRRLVARPVLVAATMAGIVVTAGLLPAVSERGATDPLPEVRPAADRRLPEAAPAPRARPVSFAIPALDVNGPLGELSRADNGELLAPDDPGLAGWYTGGIVPGDVGPAVIGGHVDSRRGPGVFFRLRSLAAGDVVRVTRSDGRVVRFTVTAVREVPKAQFPTDAVYAPTARPELRLITCGGRFDRAARNYVDNVVVDAVATDSVTDSETMPLVRPN